MIGTNDERWRRTRQAGVRRGVAALALAVCFCVAPTAFAQAEPEQVQKLLADDGEAGDGFGRSVAMSGDTALIRAPGADHEAGWGLVYVFGLEEGTWVQQAILLPDDAEEGQGFSCSIALDGDTAVIGANGDDEHGFGSGAAYVFVREGDAWIQQAKIYAGDPNVFDSFGSSVAVHGDTAVIGAYQKDLVEYQEGAAYVFVREDGIWTQQAKLIPDDVESGDRFGHRVAVYGDTALIQASNGETGINGVGAVYVFERTRDVWTEQGKLMVDDLEEGDGYGSALALEGDTALVGASAQNSSTGAVYVFRRDGDAWPLYDKLIAADGAEGDVFGGSVALSGDFALIGARYANFDRGAAYVFYLLTGVQIQKVVADEGEANDNFYRVALVDDTALIGASGDDDNGAGAGAGYIFDLHLDCPADIVQDGEVNSADLLRLLALWGEEGGEADINYDGIVNTADLLQLLAAWGECP